MNFTKFSKITNASGNILFNNLAADFASWTVVQPECSQLWFGEHFCGTMDSKYPVFVFPNTLKFYLQSRQTHKQLLTIYNPSDNAVRFKVLSTAPNKYTVIDPDGTIGPRACVDIVVRHTMPVLNNCNITDKFRVQMQDQTTRQVLGKKDIEATLFSGEINKQPSVDGDNFHSLQHDDSIGGDDRQQRFNRNMNRTLPNVSTNYIIIILGIVCVLALLLPTHQENPLPSTLPVYLHLPVHVKLVFAYALGLVTMVVFRP